MVPVTRGMVQPQHTTSGSTARGFLFSNRIALDAPDSRERPAPKGGIMDGEIVQVCTQHHPSLAYGVDSDECHLCRVQKLQERAVLLRQQLDRAIHSATTNECPPGGNDFGECQKSAMECHGCIMLWIEKGDR